jgi:LysR family cys regulon transcriptional activator
MIVAPRSHRIILRAMKLQQLRYLAAIAQSELNISAAARRLHTSQPGISKQIRLLEEEIGLPIFEREGRTLTRLTPVGSEVISRALRVLAEVDGIKRLADDGLEQVEGALSIGTTHTQARYVLPGIFKHFTARYPGVELHLHQGTSEQIAEMARLDQIDFAVATGSKELFPGTVMLPCYRWHRCIVVPQGHPLASDTPLTLEKIARFPIVTYVFSLQGSSSLRDIFERAGLALKIALTARDADVIQTYVKLGFGVGIVASMAVEAAALDGLVTLDASHLFPAHTTWIGFRQGTLLRRYMFDFVELLAPHLTRRVVSEAARLTDVHAVERLFRDVELPLLNVADPVAPPVSAAGPNAGWKTVGAGPRRVAPEPSRPRSPAGRRG